MYPVAVAKVADALGGRRALGVRIETMGDLLAAVAGGLPRAVVGAVAVRAAPATPEGRGRIAALVASPATLKRSPRLSPAASERAERLARVTALAAVALGDEETARDWLNAPHPMLGDGPPIALAATDLGARLVERVLLNAEHGLPA